MTVSQYQLHQSEDGDSVRQVSLKPNMQSFPLKALPERLHSKIEIPAVTRP